VARTTISIDDSVYKAGLKRAKALGYKKFSPYCEHLIRKDLAERPEHVTVLREEEPPWPSKTEKPRGSSAA
jgi:predicted CopG family antitoxin